MNKIIFRKATFNDLPIMKVIHDKAARTCCSHYSQKEIEAIIENRPEEKIKKSMQKDGRVFILILLDQKPAGYFCYNLIDCDINFLFIDSDFQGKGIGRACMEEIERIFQENGKTKIKLIARLNAVSFYEKFGFIKTTIRHRTVCGIKIQTQNMEKDLTKK